jgi:hypothetical protein
MIIIKKASENDLENWLKLRKELWPTCLEEKHYREIKAYLSSHDKCALLAFMDTDAVGF